VDAVQRRLSQACYDKFAECEQRSLVARIIAERKDIRFYTTPTGRKDPSITSILGWDRDFFISKEDLLQYAARGTIVHRQIEIFATEGRWAEAKDLVECHKEYVVVKKGSLQLSLDGYHVDKFFEKFKLETTSTEEVSMNEEHKYAGRLDWKGFVDGKKTIIDWKTSQKLDKKYVLCQLAAHLFCPGNEDVEQIIGVPVNNTTAQGYSAPAIITREEAKPYFDLFLKSRDNFRYRFNA